MAKKFRIIISTIIILANLLLVSCDSSVSSQRSTDNDLDTSIAENADEIDYDQDNDLSKG